MEKKEKYPRTENKETIVTDPMGSYTGVPADKGEIPVQDADDL